MSDTDVQQQRATMGATRNDGSIWLEGAELVRHIDVGPQLLHTCCVAGMASQSQHDIQHCIVTIRSELHHAIAAVVMVSASKGGGQSITAMGTTFRQIVIRWISKTSTNQLIPIIGCH